MADIITMPKLGFDMAEGTLVRWVKKEGEKVEKGELLAEIETDKATVEVESQYSGVVLKHLIKEGTSVPVNEPIAAVGKAGEKVDAAALAGARESKGAEEPGSKGAEEPESTSAKKEELAAIPAVASKAVSASGNGHLPEGVRASPLARRMAHELGVNLGMLRGSGPQGRIVKQDVETAAKGGVPTAAAAAATAMPAPPAMQMADLGPPPADQRVPLSKLRAAIGRRMVRSRQEVPHFYVTHEFDMGRVMDARAQANALLQASGEKLSVNDFVIKAAAMALRQFPNLNAALDGDAVIRYGRVNIGVAVAVENGLLVVVCQDADRKPLRQIAAEVGQMAQRARAGNVRPEEIEGSTFSISNLGMYDVDEFVAIINPPEAAILALGSAKQVPVVKDGQIQPGWRMRGTLSVDHRVSDGAEGAQYLQALAQYLENPVALFM